MGWFSLLLLGLAHVEVGALATEFQDLGNVRVAARLALRCVAYHPAGAVLSIPDSSPLRAPASALLLDAAVSSASDPAPSTGLARAAPTWSGDRQRSPPSATQIQLP